MRLGAILLLLITTSSTGCARVIRVFGGGAGCADTPSASPGDVQNAINAISYPGALGDRLKVLVGPPFASANLRARVRVIRNDQVCRAAGATAQEWNSRDRYSVFAIGRLYWVRGTTWQYANAVDDQFQRVESFVDQ